MNIYRIEMPSNKTIELKLLPFFTIRVMKGKINLIKEIAYDAQHLFFNGIELDDDKSLQDYSIDNQSIIQLKVISSKLVCDSSELPKENNYSIIYFGYPYSSNFDNYLNKYCSNLIKRMDKNEQIFLIIHFQQFYYRNKSESFYIIQIAECFDKKIFNSSIPAKFSINLRNSIIISSPLSINAINDLNKLFTHSKINIFTVDMENDIHLMQKLGLKFNLHNIKYIQNFKLNGKLYPKDFDDDCHNQQCVESDAYPSCIEQQINKEKFEKQFVNEYSPNISNDFWDYLCNDCGLIAIAVISLINELGSKKHKNKPNKKSTTVANNDHIQKYLQILQGKFRANVLHGNKIQIWREFSLNFSQIEQTLSNKSEEYKTIINMIKNITKLKNRLNINAFYILKEITIFLKSCQCNNDKSKLISKSLFKLVLHLTNNQTAIPDPCPLYLMHDEIVNTQDRFISLEIPDGSFKTKIIPFFLAIVALNDNMKRPFIVITEPNYSVFIEKYKKIQKNLKSLVNLVKDQEQMFTLYSKYLKLVKERKTNTKRFKKSFSKQ